MPETRYMRIFSGPSIIGPYLISRGLRRGFAPYFSSSSPGHLLLLETQNLKIQHLEQRLEFTESLLETRNAKYLMGALKRSDIT